MPSNLLRILALAALAAVPLVEGNSYWLHVFSLALIAAILALGMQLLVGMAGLLSMGQGAFYGIGAYVAGSLGAAFGLPFPATLLLGGLHRGAGQPASHPHRAAGKVPVSPSLPSASASSSIL